jgi:hypothetical protein
MRIGLIGNMNNNFFALMRYFLDAGIDAKLYKFSNDPNHFSPESDTYEIEKYERQIKELPFDSPFKLGKINRLKLKRELGKFDILIVSGYGPFIMNYCDLKNYIFIPYGSDLYEYPFTSLSKRPFGVKNFVLFVLEYLLVSRLQRKGIQNASAVINIDIFESYSNALTKMNIVPIRMNIPMVYDYSISYHVVNDAEYSRFANNYMRQIRNSTFVVISQSRQYWTKSIDGASGLDMKGNDILIKGFNKFRLKCSDSFLVLFEYGPDIIASKQLINQLGMKENVIWLPKIPRKYILRLIKEYGTVGADQFTSGYFGGTGYEVMSQGIPLLSNVQLNAEEYYKAIGAPMPPVINVSNVDEVSDALSFYHSNPLALGEKRNQVLKYFNEYLGNGLAKKHLELYESIIKKNKLNVH